MVYLFRITMNIKKINSIMFKVILVILAIAIPMYLIGYYFLIKIGAELLDKLIKL